MTKFKTITLLFFLLSNLTHAQFPEHFLIDTLTNSANKALPFDRPFFLNFRGANSKSIYTGVILEWDIRNGIRTLKRNSDGKLILVNIKDTDVFLRIKGVDVYIPAQRPNQNFALFMAHHFDGKLLDEVMAINLLLNTKDTTEANKLLGGLKKKVEDIIEPVPGIPKSDLQNVSFFGVGWVKDSTAVVKDAKGGIVWDSTVVNGYNKFYKNSLKSQYDKLHNLKLTVPTNITANVLVRITQIAATAEISSVELNAFVSLASRNELQNVLSGLIAFGKDFALSSTEPFNIEARSKNLSASFKGIENLIQFSENLHARSNNPVFKGFIDSLRTLKSNIKVNQEMLKVMYKDIKSEIDKNTNLTYSTWAFGHNELWDLKTKGSYHLIPDIGITSIIGFGNEENEVIIRPYIGASIYFRPVDKSIPFKYFDKRYQFLHRFSLNIGLTVGKVEQGEFSDFFNSMNLLLGGNYKITREISFSTGVALVQRKNANPAIDDKKTTPNPYFGLSFDLDFANAIQKLTGKLSL